MMKKAMVIALAALMLLGAVPGYAADRGVYMKPNVAWAQKGWPGIVERFEGDMEAVGEYLRSEIANQQGGGIGYQVRGVGSTTPKLLDIEQLWEQMWARIEYADPLTGDFAYSGLHTHFSTDGEPTDEMLQGWVNDYGHDPYDTIEDFLDYIESQIFI